MEVTAHHLKTLLRQQTTCLEEFSSFMKGNTQNFTSNPTNTN